VASLRLHSEVIKVLRYYHADVYTQNKDGNTALDFGQDADDVKEALLTHRFSSETIEDEYLQDALPTLIEKIISPQNGEDLFQTVLCLRGEIRVATSSMTSVPKPLKFLKDHFTELQEAHEKMSTEQSEARAILSDILSVLAMAVEDKEGHCLEYRLSGSNEKISSFGHPYIRRLCSQLPDKWSSLTSPEDSLLGLVRDITIYCLDHSAEAEACDLLMEIEKIDMIDDLVSEDTHERVCLYLTRSHESIVCSL